MKKFILAIVFLIPFLVHAQLATVVVPKGDTYVKITTGYNITNAVANYTLFKAGQNEISSQDFLCHLDSVSGNHTNVAVALYGQKFDTSAFVAIGSAVSWKGTTSDTTIVISNATANRYRNYKVTYTGTGTGVTKVYLQELKLYLE